MEITRASLLTGFKEQNTNHNRKNTHDYEHLFLLSERAKQQYQEDRKYDSCDHGFPSSYLLFNNTMITITSMIVNINSP